MEIRFFILLPVLLSISLISYGQSIKWEAARNWKLYEVRTKASFYYSADTLNRFKNIDLDSTSMKGFLKEATIWPVEKVSTWMGFFNITYELDEKPRKLIVSNYGGFLYDFTGKRYYEIPKDMREAWNSFFSENYEKLE